jgi:hypothetical protein
MDERRYSANIEGTFEGLSQVKEINILKCRGVILTRTRRRRFAGFATGYCEIEKPTSY